MTRSKNSRRGSRNVGPTCRGCPACDGNREERQAPPETDVEDEIRLEGELRCLRGLCSFCGPETEEADEQGR